MTNNEIISQILDRKVSMQEKHQMHMSAEEIKVREALLWIGDVLDALTTNDTFDEDREVKFFKLGEE